MYQKKVQNVAFWIRARLPTVSAAHKSWPFNSLGGFLPWRQLSGAFSLGVQPQSHMAKRSSIRPGQKPSVHTYGFLGVLISLGFFLHMNVNICFQKPGNLKGSERFRKKKNFLQSKQMVRVNQQGKPFKIISEIFYQETHQWKLKEPGMSYIWHIFTFMKIASKQAAT